MFYPTFPRLNDVGRPLDSSNDPSARTPKESYSVRVEILINLIIAKKRVVIRRGVRNGNERLVNAKDFITTLEKRRGRRLRSDGLASRDTKPIKRNV